MRRFGYRADSVLLELVQNADDALAQAAEIAGGSLPSAARRLEVNLDTHDNVQILDVIHYGRPINDTGGASFPAGRDRQWDQDLYFMMLLNLSGKPGEIAGQESSSSTTGRFGLGFKSIHLVSQCPSVVSGFLAFSIEGGLLPEEHSVPNNLNLFPIEGHRPTRIRLPLHSDLNKQDVEDLFRRFDYARALLPALARQLREVVVQGGPSPGVSVFDGNVIDGAPQWSISAEATALPNHGFWRILRFRPGALSAAGTTALVVGLRQDHDSSLVPSPFPSDLPFLWNVTPTSEGWGCGYVVNGPFKLDPGRTHVSLDDEATLRVVDRLGEAVGQGLIDLHDALERGVGAYGLPSGGKAMAFLQSLWRVLASGIDTRDELRQKLLLRLHDSGRGLSAWMQEREVVPSGLPAPFPSQLSRVAADMRIEVAVGGLDDANLCSALSEIEDLVLLVKQRHSVVSSEVARLLRPLLRAPIQQLQPADILSELTEHWNQKLTPSRLRMLRRLTDETNWQVLVGEGHARTWQSHLVAQSADKTRKPALLRKLILPPASFNGAVPDADVADELLRAAFAPDSWILAPEYIQTAEDAVVFRRLRGPHEVDAATLASWYEGLRPDRRDVALRYLLHGRLQQEVLQHLIPATERPSWLTEYDDVRRMLGGLGAAEWRRQQLLAALFPGRFLDHSLSQEAIQPEKRRAFFELLIEWWDDEEKRNFFIELYEEDAWPNWLRSDGVADNLNNDSDDHWLGLLVLGACQSLGRAKDEHHRSFLELAQSEGWWKVFRAPDETGSWMKILRDWQDRSVTDLRYSKWMSLFPSIYQLSRYLKTYRRLLRTAGKRPEDLYKVENLLSPRVDEALSGAGQHFDAPPAPLNMGLHWILRELVRQGVIDGEHVYPDCWVPSAQVIDFLQRFGLPLPAQYASNPAKARAIFDFLRAELGTPAPHLHRAFDIPLRFVAADADVRQELGLQQLGF